MVIVCLTMLTPTEYKHLALLSDRFCQYIAVPDVHVKIHSQSNVLSYVLQFGGLPSLRHNEIRYLTANLMIDVSHNVSIEPNLQPITRETFPTASTNTEGVP